MIEKVFLSSLSRMEFNSSIWMGGYINFENAIANKKLFDLIYIFDDEAAFIIAIFVEYKQIIYFFHCSMLIHKRKNQIKLIQFDFFSLSLFSRSPIFSRFILRRLQLEWSPCNGRVGMSWPQMDINVECPVQRNSISNKNNNRKNMEKALNPIWIYIYMWKSTGVELRKGKKKVTSKKNSMNVLTFFLVSFQK